MNTVFSQTFSINSFLIELKKYFLLQTTPKECIEDFVQIALETGTQFNCFHHHLVNLFNFKQIIS